MCDCLPLLNCCPFCEAFTVAVPDWYRIWLALVRGSLLMLMPCFWLLIFVLSLMFMASPPLFIKIDDFCPVFERLCRLTACWFIAELFEKLLLLLRFISAAEPTL